jgi:hypothetical protein
MLSKEGSIDLFVGHSWLRLTPDAADESIFASAEKGAPRKARPHGHQNL